MTVTRSRTGLVTLTIDATEITVPEGTLVIRAAELLGVEIPRFCDHPLLDPVGACRQCLVEVAGQRKPATACTTVVAEGMVVRTQATSAAADRAQQGVLELLLINHPLDCPVCDKGGECPLQNQAMSSGHGVSRFDGRKRTFPKPVAVSDRILLDRERCVQCARCTRFAAQIAGDPMIELMERGAEQQIGTGTSAPFDSYFSGNTIQICPVGALTSTDYRFRSRPFDLVSTPSVCEHCASGCATRTDARHGTVLRRLAADDPDINEEWNCDKGRWAFRYATATDRLTVPYVRDRGTGRWEPVPWPVAIGAAARGLAGRVGVLTGGRLTVEDAYAYAKFARVALGTNDVDFRARPHSAEETRFLTALAGRTDGPTYADLERAPVVLLVGLEPQDESPIVFLRLRKAVRRNKTVVVSLASFATDGLAKLSGLLLPTVPGDEARLLGALAELPQDGLGGVLAEVAGLLRRRGAVILTGERLATSPGALSAARALAGSTGALLGWVPRRAGDRGALEAGAFPVLLPGGRPVADPSARAATAAIWQVPGLPGSPGRDTDGILAAAAADELDALVVGGVEPDDLRQPRAALLAMRHAQFVVSLELRESAVTEHADVVFPVSAVAEKAGTFLNWENRRRPFTAAVPGPDVRPDFRVLHAIAAELGVDLGLPDLTSIRGELARFGPWPGEAAPAVPVPPTAVAPKPGAGQAVLATWRMLLDDGRLQDAGTTRRPPVVRLSAATADEIHAADGDPVTVRTTAGAVTLPLAVTELPDRVVWLPANSPGSHVHATLGATAGDLVRIGLSASVALERKMA